MPVTVAVAEQPPPAKPAKGPDPLARAIRLMLATDPDPVVKEWLTALLEHDDADQDGRGEK